MHAYNRHFLIYETVISFVIAGVLIATANSYFGTSVMNSWILRHVQNISNLVAIVSSTLLGFALVGVSIIFGFMGNERLKILRESKQGATVYSIYFQAIAWLALTLVLSFVEYAIGYTARLPIFGYPIGVILACIMVFTAIVSTFRLWRCVWIIQKLAILNAAPRYENVQQAQISR